MHQYLSEILANKALEVEQLKAQLHQHPNEQLALLARGEIRRPGSHKFKKAIEHLGLSVIAEIKRRSPSKGALATITEPVALAQAYLSGGADAISVLTDKMGFDGCLADLESVKALTVQTDVAVLQKDFIIDAVQIAQAVHVGADCILLIVAALKEQTQQLLAVARSFDIDAIVEVHTDEELSMALSFGAEIIGINNRNLQTFDVDINQSFELIKNMPKGILTIAESGISQVSTAHQFYQAGFNGILVGEALVKDNNPAAVISAMKAVESL